MFRTISCFLVLFATSAFGETVASLAERSRPALVTISKEGRDGTISASGSGVFISEDGLIATCLHVIGEARRIHVTGSDGTKYQLKSVHATDRKADLALLRTTVSPPSHLLLAPPDSLAQGDRVIAMGNPQGLEFSVTEGVLSALREPMLDAAYGRMLQVAIPIEQGNSGGPLLDMQGRVQGLLSVKSLVTPNLGFASPADSVRSLLETPNPVPYEKWLTIGVLDPEQWDPQDGDWRQRSGRILATAPGAGFAGRTLCLSTETVGTEIAVSVKLDDESGAAGLAFCVSDDGSYYGFYPTNGRLRLTRFEGPDVYSWAILEDVDSPAYRAGEWNELHVTITQEKIRCAVNGKTVIESDDTKLRGGSAGLVKFREPDAAFRSFRTGVGIASPTLDPAAEEALRLALATLTPGSIPLGETADTLLAAPPADARRLIEDRARDLEDAAAELRNFFVAAQAARITSEIVDTANSDPSLAALLLAKIENPDLDPAPYIEELERLANEIPDTPTISDLIALIFEENGFHGSRSEFTAPENCFLDSVLDDREGIPISLAVLMTEIARRAGIDGLSALILPGVVIVRDGAGNFYEPFERGRSITTAEAQELADSYAAPAPAPDVTLHPAATGTEAISRLAQNLKSHAIDREDYAIALLYADVIHALDPENPQAVLSRAILRLQTEDLPGAAADFEWLLENEAPGIDLGNIRSALRRINASALLPPVK
ncbi:trypsin-like peptidase domain-containing protein [Verrucomicrobiales bacterium]|nr:trypsin-like peptidase domain-containing protein [Verrucomicrobiales bacterium]